MPFAAGKFDVFIVQSGYRLCATADILSSDEQVPAANLPIQYPRVPGHEIIGEVVAIPASERLWKVGQRVGGGWHGGHCMACTSCRKGDFVTCQNEDINGTCGRAHR